MQKFDLILDETLLSDLLFMCENGNNIKLDSRQLKLKLIIKLIKYAYLYDFNSF